MRKHGTVTARKNSSHEPPIPVEGIAPDPIDARPFDNEATEPQAVRDGMAREPEIQQLLPRNHPMPPTNERPHSFVID